MGTLRSQTNLSGVTVNGVLLGDPVAPVRSDSTPAQIGDSMSDLWFAWDDSAFPNGTVDSEGNVTPDETTEV